MAKKIKITTAAASAALLTALISQAQPIFSFPLPATISIHREYYF